MSKPEVTRTFLFDMQVCIPKEWKDKQVVEFANTNNPTGTDHGWYIRKQGSKYLVGDDERVSCVEHDGMVHIMLDC